MWQGADALTEAELERIEEVRVAVIAEQNREAVNAVADLGKSLFSAFFDAGIGAVAAAAGSEDAAAGLQEKLRANSMAEARRSKLVAFERELSILGIAVEEAGDLDERALRDVFRTRSRLLHPDLNPSAEGIDLSEFKGGVVPTI